MKKVCFISAMALLLNVGVQAQYCTPPDFTSGPYTGIINVKFGSVDKTTPGTEGYRDFSATENASVTKGETVPISVELEHTILNGFFSDRLDLRIWIDWNQDQDFDDPGEEVIANEVDLSIGAGSYNTATFTGSIVVPTDAKLGETRMRVYEDMLVSDGHEIPNPCGYSSGIGQHGECEDYTVTVETTSSIQKPSDQLDVSVYPNPVIGQLNINIERVETAIHSIKVFNSAGEEVLLVAEGPELLTQKFWDIDVSGLAHGLHFLKIESDGSNSVYPIQINH